jgi:hypothetical protein
VKAAETALAANLMEAHDFARLSEKKRKFDNAILAQETVLAEHQYTFNPDALCDGQSDTKAVENLKAQLGLVEAMGWKTRLVEQSPALDLTLGQTKTETSSVKEHRAALLTTLRAIVTHARTLELEVIREPTTRQLCRDLSMPGAEVVTRRVAFVDENNVAAAAASAMAAEIANKAKAVKDAAKATADALAEKAAAAKVADAAEKASRKANAAERKRKKTKKPIKRRAPEPPAAPNKRAVVIRPAVQNATRTSARNRTQFDCGNL